MRDVAALERLLRGALGAPLGGRPQRRHLHGIEAQRDLAQRHVDDVLGADGAFDQSGPDEPVLQHLAHLGAEIIRVEWMGKLDFTRADRVAPGPSPKSAS